MSEKPRSSESVNAHGGSPEGDGAQFELPAGVLAVRRGPGANCSSVGSLIDILFGAAVVGGTLYAAIAASIGDERQAEAAKEVDGDREVADAPSTRNEP